MTCANLEGVGFGGGGLEIPNFLNFRKYASSFKPPPPPPPTHRKLKFSYDHPGKNIWISPWITRSYVYIFRSYKSNISNTFAFCINNFNHLFNCFVMEKKNGVISYSRFKLQPTSFIKNTTT